MEAGEALLQPLIGLQARETRRELGTGGFLQAGAFWSRRTAETKEYRVVRDGDYFRAGLCQQYIFRSRYEHALRELKRLLREYRGVSLECALPGGREVETSAGPCFRIDSRAPAPVWEPDPGSALPAIISDLVLVHGIGEKTAARLRNRGYDTLESLTEDPVYGPEAARAVSEIRDRNLAAIQRRLERWRGASHPRSYMVLGLADPRDLVFFDIETLGIFSRPIILLGYGRLRGDEIRVSQYLLREIREEEAALHAAADGLDRMEGAVVTYNGRSFDLPYIRDRWAYYGTPGALPPVNFDLFHFCRRIFGRKLPDLRLTTIEEVLSGIRRSGDIPGPMVPEFYEAYRRTGNPGPLTAIVAHNRQDVISLVHIASSLWRWCSAGP
ncbi:MAG: ribonuclease H-like domain-containing protein [Methanoculleaceae archaeon]